MKKVCTHETYLYESIEEMNQHNKVMMKSGWKQLNVNYNVYDQPSLHTAMYEKDFV